MNPGQIIHSGIIHTIRIVYRKSETGFESGVEFSNGNIKWFPNCWIEKFNNGVATVKQLISHDPDFKSISGMINLQGEWLIPPKYSTIDIFSEDHSFAVNFDEEGVNHIFQFCGSLIAESAGNTTFLIDTSGNEIKKFEGNFFTGIFNEGLSKISRIEDDLTMTSGFIDYTGNTIIPLEYESEFCFDLDNDKCSEGIICIQHLGKYGYCDKFGKVVIPFIYDTGTRFSCGLAGVSSLQESGFIDRSNRVAIPFEYQETKIFQHGYAPAKKNEKWGLIDVQNNKKIDFNYDELNILTDHFVFAKQGGYWGIIDIQNNIIVPFEYEGYEVLQNYENDRIIFSKEGKRAIMDMEFKIIIKPEYEMVKEINRGIYLFTNGNMQGITDERGNTITFSKRLNELF